MIAVRQIKIMLPGVSGPKLSLTMASESGRINLWKSLSRMGHFCWYNIFTERETMRGERKYEGETDQEALSVLFYCEGNQTHSALLSQTALLPKLLFF